MNKLHSGLTVAVAIKDGKSAELSAALKRLQPVNPNPKIFIRKFPGIRANALGSNNSGSDQNSHVEGENIEVLVNEISLEVTNRGGWGGNIINPPINPIIHDLGNEENDDTNFIVNTNATESRTIPVREDNSPLNTNGNPAINNIISQDRGIDPGEENMDLILQKSVCDFESSESTLFATAVILPAQNYNDQILPATLVFATTYWGSLSNHLDELIKTSKTGLCEIFEHCVDFPDSKSVMDSDLTNYLKKHSYRSAFHSRYSGMTKQEVKNEKELRIEIEDYLDKANNYLFLNGQHPKTVKKLIERHIKAQGDRFTWAEKTAKDSLFEFLTKRRAIILLGLVVLIILGVTVYASYDSLGWFLSAGLAIEILASITIISYTILFIIRVLIASQKNLTAPRPPDAQVRKVAATQLRPIINEMTAAAPLKQGWLRRHFYSFALYFIGLGCEQLMNIPTVTSIRWLSIDKRRRLLFLSNYSNTTDFYVREFLTGKTPLGVNFMFTHGSGFPDARLLRYGGISKDPEGYMNVIHTHQHTSDIWYAHDYDLTIDEIKRNRKIRNGLFAKMNKEETTRWLQMF